MIRTAILLMLTLASAVKAEAHTWAVSREDFPAVWKVPEGTYAAEIKVRFKSMDVPAAPGTGKEWVAVELIDSISCDTCRMELRAELAGGDSFDDRAGYLLTCGNKNIRFTEARKQRLFNRVNTLTISLTDRTDAAIHLDRLPFRAITTGTACRNKIRISAGGGCKLENAEIEYQKHAAETVTGTAEEISKLIGPQPVSGFFGYLDRENDPKMAEPGGFYTLAVIPGNDGKFDIIYIKGARVNETRWKTGMKKGTLTPTEFIGHYDMTWIDSEGIEMTDELWATFLSADGILELNFPLYNTRLRFRKLRH